MQNVKLEQQRCLQESYVESEEDNEHEDILFPILKLVLEIRLHILFPGEGNNIIGYCFFYYRLYLSQTMFNELFHLVLCC
jgi:hypothetical protein